MTFRLELSEALMRFIVVCLCACRAGDTVLVSELDTPSETAGPSAPVPDAGSAPDADARVDRSSGAEERVALRLPEACTAAELLKPTADGEVTSFDVAGSNRMAADTSQSSLGACSGATLGPDVWHLLDLTDMTGPVDVVAVLDADFDAALDLREGPCGDSISRECERASAGALPSSMLGARLEPGRYWLVVDGRARDSQGQFRLQVAVDARRGACEQSGVPSSCVGPPRMDVRQRATTLLDVSCASPEEERRSYYFELDLRAEPQPVVATLTAWGLGEPRFGRVAVYPASAPEADCSLSLVESYVSNGRSRRIHAEVGALLVPDRYVIAVVDIERLDDAGEASPLALTVTLDRERCRSGARGNTCDSALELETRSGIQVVSGDTACNANLLTISECDPSEAPEQLHRLDLSAQAGPARVRMGLRVDGIEFSPVLALMAAGPDGGCGEPLHCYDSIDNAEGLPLYDLTLQPGVYFIGVDGNQPGAAGRYQLFVEVQPGSTRPCVDRAMFECQYRNYLSSDAGCCQEPENLGCARALELCGLAPETTACVCGANPACCGAEGSREGCPGLFAACGYLCPEFAPSEDTCALSYR